MGIWPKMPTIWIDRFESFFSQYTVVCLGRIIRINVAVFPIIAILDIAKMVVSVEHHVPNTLCLELLMKLPNGFVCLCSTCFPINVGNVLFVALFEVIGYLVYAAGVYLHPVIVAIKPLFSFPS